MKLSKAQLEYIQRERVRMAARLCDLDSFGDDIYKSAKLSGERNRIYYDRWLFNRILELHNVEVKAEKDSFKELCDVIEKELGDE